MAIEAQARLAEALKQSAWRHAQQLHNTFVVLRVQNKSRWLQVRRELLSIPTNQTWKHRHEAF